MWFVLVHLKMKPDFTNFASVVHLHERNVSSMQGAHFGYMRVAGYLDGNGVGIQLAHFCVLLRAAARTVDKPDRQPPSLQMVKVVASEFLNYAELERLQVHSAVQEP